MADRYPQKIQKGDLAEPRTEHVVALSPFNSVDSAHISHVRADAGGDALRSQGFNKTVARAGAFGSVYAALGAMRKMAV